MKFINPMAGHGQAGQHAGSAWSTYWARSIAVFKKGPFFGQPVQIRSVDNPASVGTQRVESLLVGHQDQDIGPLRLHVVGY